jgi:hypothetical protein
LMDRRFLTHAPRSLPSQRHPADYAGARLGTHCNPVRAALNLHSRRGMRGHGLGPDETLRVDQRRPRWTTTIGRRRLVLAGSLLALVGLDQS